MLSDPNISSPANIDASVMWRDNKGEFLKKSAKLVEVANFRVPKHVLIPHPDTDPIQKQSRLDKMKLMNDLNNFSMTNMEDSDEMGSEDLDDDDDDVDIDDEKDGSASGSEIIVDIVDCPVCQANMLPGKNGTLSCATCPIQHREKTYLCGRKCYVFDCGEIRPTGACKNVLRKESGWKCELKTHKDDKDGEENFLENMV